MIADNDTLLTGFSGLVILIVLIALAVHFIRKL